MPDTGGFFAAHEWLPVSATWLPVAATYDDPELLRADRSVVAPVFRVHGTKAQWRELLRRFDGADMLTLALEGELPTDARGRPVRNGFMSLAKDEASDRTVCVRVPRNKLEKQLRLCGDLLPHGCQFCEAQLDEGAILTFEIDDIGDYYHVFEVSQARAMSNAIGPLISEADLEGTRALAAARARLGETSHRPRRWQPCLAALPMGDLNAVDYGQLAHMNVIRAHGGMKDEHLLRYRAPVPRAGTWDGVIVDDHVVARQVPRAAAYRQSPEFSCAHAAYAAAGLTAKDSKKKRGVTTAEFWGAPVDGLAGRARARDDIIQRAVAFTIAVLQLGVATAEIWSSAVGLWTHVLLFRRVAFGLLGDVYDFHPREGDVLRRSARAREEMLWLLMFAPLFETDIRAPVATTVSATDASPWTCAVVEAEFSASVVKEL